jgi:hypothetical protein
MSDSRSAARELAFRARLLVGLAGLGGLGGGLLYLGWATGWRELTLLQYARILQRVFADGELEYIRNELLLSVAAGAVFLSLPVIVFYIRRLSAGK